MPVEASKLCVSSNIKENYVPFHGHSVPANTILACLRACSMHQMHCALKLKCAHANALANNG